MPSDQLIEAIELYDEHERDKDPSKRVEACQKMWQTQDPEAIEALSIIYREDPDEKVRAAAAAALRNFRQLQQERQSKRSKSVAGDVAKKRGGAGSKGASRFLTLTLVLLVAANVVVFFMKNSGSDKDESGPPTRTEVIADIRTVYLTIIADAEGLQEELNKIGQLNDRPNCNRAFKRPQLLELGTQEVERYPDLVDLVAPETSDLAFALTALDLGFQFWDSSCAAGQFDTDAVSGIANRLQIAIDTSSAALSGLETLTTPPPTPNPDLLPLARDRADILAEIQTTVSAIISDATGLQEELSKLEQGNQPDCTRSFIHPQLVVLTPEEAEQNPDLVAIVDQNSDLVFAWTGLDLSRQFWDGGCLVGQFVSSEISVTLGRLQTTITTATAVLNGLPTPP